ncbi:hypothetical protein [Corallococcus exiguus]|uniref:hypothetical protein n=1 Tax=Corallococcus exiguus TaxID=83462 RepID=UPI003DA48613
MLIFRMRGREMTALLLAGASGMVTVSKSRFSVASRVPEKRRFPEASSARAKKVRALALGRKGSFPVHAPAEVKRSKFLKMTRPLVPCSETSTRMLFTSL